MIIIYHPVPFSRFSSSFAPAEKKKFPEGIGPVINIALFGIGRAGTLFVFLDCRPGYMPTKEIDFSYFSLIRLIPSIL